MKNYIQDGDFRSVTPGSFTITSAPAIGSFWASSGTSTISGPTRGTFAASVVAFAGAASAIPSQPSLQKYFQFSISSPVALQTGQFYAQISATIPNGNRIFAGSRARFSFWINSTSRYIGIRMARNFGSGSTTAVQNTDTVFNITPNIWQQVSFDFTVPTFAPTDDLESADYLQFNIILDNVATPSVFSLPVSFVESSTLATPTVKVTAVSCELVSNSPGIYSYENAAISDTSQLTDKNSLLGASGVPADGSVTSAKIAAGAVVAGKLSGGAVVLGDIAAGAVHLINMDATLFGGSIVTATGTYTVASGLITAFTPV